MKTAEVEILAEIGLCERYFCVKGLIGNGKKFLEELRLKFWVWKKLWSFQAVLCFFTENSKTFRSGISCENKFRSTWRR